MKKYKHFKPLKNLYKNIYFRKKYFNLLKKYINLLTNIVLKIQSL